MRPAGGRSRFVQNPRHIPVPLTLSIPLMSLFAAVIIASGYRRAANDAQRASTIGAPAFFGCLGAVTMASIGAAPNGYWTAAPELRLTAPIWLTVAFPLSLALLWSAGALLRRRECAAPDAFLWVLSTAILILIVAASSIGLLDSQLLALAGLALIWWRASSRHALFTSPVARPAFVSLIAATLGLGILGIVHVLRIFRDAVASLPGGASSQPLGAVLGTIAEVAASQPALSGLSMLRLAAWAGGAATVVIVWIIACPPESRPAAARIGAAFLALAGLLLLLSGLLP